MIITCSFLYLNQSKKISNLFNKEYCLLKKIDKSFIRELAKEDNVMCTTATVINVIHGQEAKKCLKIKIKKIVY